MRSISVAVLLSLATSLAMAAPAAKPKPAPAAEAPSLPPEEVVRRANAFLNGLSSLSAAFVQTNPDGKRVAGRLYLQRPGRIRFDYDAPVPLEIVADGQNLIVRDRKLGTSSVYPVSQTPLTFLLQDNIDIARDLKLTGVARTEAGTYVAFESSSTFIGTSRVAIVFDDEITTLRQWRVVDTQSKQTMVSLTGVDRTPIEDARTFDIRFQRQQ